MASPVVSQEVFNFHQCLKWLIHVFVPFRLVNRRTYGTFFVSVMEILNILLVEFHLRAFDEVL